MLIEKFLNLPTVQIFYILFYNDYFYLNYYIVVISNEYSQLIFLLYYVCNNKNHIFVFFYLDIIYLQINEYFTTAQLYIKPFGFYVL